MAVGRLILGCVLCVVVSSNVEQHFSVYQTVEKITADGFQAETHKVTTSDGYILEMHRIPRGRSEQTPSEDRPVVFLMHGLLSNSQSFIAIGPELSFAYNLADAGFDVWMGNARGNKNSRFHATLNPDDAEQKAEFFNFSFEEIGTEDLPAMIDYVLEYTKRDKLHYIGHSQGGTVFLVMASLKPEYNEKMASVHLLAAVGYQEHFPDSDLSQTAMLTDQIYAIALQMGAVELFPPGSTQMLPDLPGGIELPFPSASSYCLGNVKFSYMCQLFGIHQVLPMMSNYNAATDQPGAALKQIAHYGQNIRDKLFRRFDYKAEENMNKYGTTEPPKYDLSLISSFVTMHYTLSDHLLDENDVLAMVADIPKAIARQVARTTFSHSDFVVAADAKELVTDYIIDAVKNAEQENHYTVNDGVIVADGSSTVPSSDGSDATTDSSSTASDTGGSDAPTDAPSTASDTGGSDPTTDAPSTASNTGGSDAPTDAPSTASSTDAPSTTTSPDGAATIVINVYLMILSLYVMLM